MPTSARALSSALFDAAFVAQRYGDPGRAITLYTGSIAILPSAEAYTYRGWARSLLGRYDRAIDDCRKAIKVDPGFGNPYNDIGAYLIELGRSSEAIEWLHRAIRAPRYDARYYPYMNLGRIHLRRGELRRALVYFQSCLDVGPHFEPAQRAVEALSKRLN